MNDRALSRVSRRGPARSDSPIPISARSSVPLNPRGPATGFFEPANYHAKSQPGNVSRARDLTNVPMSAWTGSVKNGKGKLSKAIQR